MHDYACHAYIIQKYLKKDTLQWLQISSMMSVGAFGRFRQGTGLKITGMNFPKFRRHPQRHLKRQQRYPMASSTSIISIVSIQSLVLGDQLLLASNQHLQTLEKYMSNSRTCPKSCMVNHCMCILYTPYSGSVCTTIATCWKGANTDRLDIAMLGEERHAAHSWPSWPSWHFGSGRFQRRAHIIHGDNHGTNHDLRVQVQSRSNGLREKCWGLSCCKL